MTGLVSLYSRPDIAQLEINLMAHIHHSRQYHIMQTIPRIRALRHDMRFQRHPLWRTPVVLLRHDGDEERDEADKDQRDQGSDGVHDALLPLARRRLGPGAHVRSLGGPDILLELGERGLGFSVGLGLEER